MAKAKVSGEVLVNGKSNGGDIGAGLRQQVSITAPNIKTAKFEIVGTAPYCQARFPEKAMRMMAEKHQAGSTAKKGRVREARDFEAEWKSLMHVSTEGWVGIPATAFRAAMVSACRLVDFKMTLAKMSVFIEADGYDRVDGTPLVKIIGTPEKNIMAVRNATGVADLRARPFWRTWGCSVRIRFDCDRFTIQDITNLLMRVGMQVGLGEGRPDSRESVGLGWGTFALKEE